MEGRSTRGESLGRTRIDGCFLPSRTGHCISGSCLPISSTSRCVSYPIDVIAFKARTLKVNTNSVERILVVFIHCKPVKPIQPSRPKRQPGSKRLK